METLITELVTMSTTVGGKIIYAVLILIIGNIIVKLIMRSVEKISGFTKLEASIKSFATSLIKILLYLILAIAVIEVLGIPMTSVLTVLASAGLAIGLSLQGALSNFAGGLMILFFKPFKIGDYISATGAEGTVSDISVFYTSIITVDNKRITVPNGSLMNANVTNYSSEELRRADLVFKAAFGTDANTACGVILRAAESTDKVVMEPVPFARLSGYSDNAVEFTLRAWCKNEDYWQVYFDLIANVNTAFADNGIQAPATKIDVNLSK